MTITKEDAERIYGLVYSAFQDSYVSLADLDLAIRAIEHFGIEDSLDLRKCREQEIEWEAATAARIAAAPPPVIPWEWRG